MIRSNVLKFIAWIYMYICGRLCSMFVFYLCSAELKAQTECTPCSPGKYCDAPGITSPKGSCDPGYLCWSRATSKTPNDNITGVLCPAGGWEKNLSPLFSIFMRRTINHWQLQCNNVLVQWNIGSYTVQYHTLLQLKKQISSSFFVLKVLQWVHHTMSTDAGSKEKWSF